VSQEGSTINIIIYGEPGVGKSVLAGTSNNGLLLLNDGDEGSSAARQGSTCDSWVVHDYNDLTDAYEYLRHEDHGYDWVWLDNASLFQEQGMDQIMEDLIAEKPHRNRFVPDMQQYLVNQNRMSLLLRNLKSLPVNFGMTAHVMEWSDEEGETRTQPAFQGGQGAFSQKICGYMNIVGYLHVKKIGDKEERILLTQKTAKRVAKDRFNALGGRVVNPTIPKITALISSPSGPDPQAKKKKASSAPRKRTSK
jgi:hypothetical protein